MLSAQWRDVKNQSDRMAPLVVYARRRQNTCLMKTSLPQRSEHMAERLAAITDVIRELVGDDLIMIVLFGSYARGTWVLDRYVEDGITYTYESDFDLLVVSEDRAHATMDGEFRLCDAIGRRVRRGLDLTGRVQR